MANEDDLDKPVKKISFSDMMHTKLRTAPELKDAPDTDGSESEAPEEPAKVEDDAPEEDVKTDKAVDDIVRNEGDEVLKAQDKTVEEAADTKTGFGQKVKRFFANWWGSPKKRWITIGLILVVLGVLGGMPNTRYTIAGTVMKADVTITVVDSKTGDPVSGATVELGTQKAETDARGVAAVKVPTGSQDLSVSKSYYKKHASKHMVGFSGNNFKATLEATGRQVKVTILNQFTRVEVANAVIAINKANTKTDEKGVATVVLPSSTTTEQASVSLDGYNTAKIIIDVSKQNTFYLTPAGKLYFLSNLEGRIDVVKTDLDGTNRTVVLEGTGKENKNETSLLASRDWKYLALLAKRGDNASLYLIDTTNGDLLTTIDEGDATFRPIGWSGQRFVYTVHRNGYSSWQENQWALKSFDATTGHTLLLDQTGASGTSDSDSFYQYIGRAYLIDDQVVYDMGWNKYSSNPTPFGDKMATLETIGVNGTGHKVIKSFAATGTYTNVGIGTELYAPRALYISFAPDYYEYRSGKLTALTDMTDEKYYDATYETYLLSPNGANTFWAETRDGKNALLVGNLDADNPKQVIPLGEYRAYGWYTDNYLLLSKNNSELYIMPTAAGTPYAVTDYYKPAYSYGGYGGL